MYQNLLNKNPLLNQFNGYITENPNITPFQTNQLINNNVHIMNNLSNLIQQHKNVQQKMNEQNYTKSRFVSDTKSNQKNKKQNINLIEEMLKPQIIEKNNSDVSSNYQVRQNIQENAKSGKSNIKITNAPYKTIIKDKIISKNVNDVKKEDLIVHKVVAGIDSNLEKFNNDLSIKKLEKEKVNDELNIEFHIDNYSKHKKKFEYKETFIRNMAFEQNTFDENKQDYIDFYRTKQKEAEEGKKLCDEILHRIDTSIINKDELPTEPNTTSDEVDLKSLMGQLQTDEMVNTVMEKNIDANNTNGLKNRQIKIKIPKQFSQSPKKPTENQPKIILSGGKKIIFKNSNKTKI